ncbi:unnamed protein product [Closterium sp. NIES-65]|nr:unnamed protein product [Closterium sp. NIES-65]
MSVTATAFGASACASAFCASACASAFCASACASACACGASVAAAAPPINQALFLARSDKAVGFQVSAKGAALLDVFSFPLVKPSFPFLSLFFFLVLSHFPSPTLALPHSPSISYTLPRSPSPSPLFASPPFARALHSALFHSQRWLQGPARLLLWRLKSRSPLSALPFPSAPGLFTVLSFILSDGCKALPDYRMLVHAPTAAPPSAAAAAATSGAGTVTDGKTAGQGEEQQKQQQQQQWRFSLWCLNPAVAFRSVASACRTIVLTSGTLSPTESFASELGIDFTCTMEGMHVVDSTTQVWAGVIPRGPSGLSLNASYANACSPVFQDELAEALLPILAATPGGMLLFLPSFWLLDALCARWKATSAWHRLSSLKKIFCEPRGVEKLEGVLTRYRREVQQSATKPWTPLAVPQHSSGAAPGGARAEASAAAAETSDVEEGGKGRGVRWRVGGTAGGKGRGSNGAMLMAVCRGKVRCQWEVEMCGRVWWERLSSRLERQWSHADGRVPREGEVLVGGGDVGGCGGAVKIGKASEGIDFADDSARAVGVSENSQKHRNDLCCQNPKRLFLLDPCSAHSPRNPVTLPLLLSTATLPDTFAVSLPFSLFSSPSFPPLSSPAPFPPSTPPLSS